MAISANNPRLSNQIKSDVPEIQQKEAALLKMDPTNVADLEVGSKRLTEISSGNWQFQMWNGSQWVNVGKLKMDVDTVDGYDASVTPKANTVAVRGSDGKLQDSITGNAATADTAVSLSQTLVVGKGGTGATTSEQARANLGVPPTSHASANTTYGLSSESVYGHAKASSDAPAQDTDDGAVGIKTSEFARGDHSHKKVLGNASTYGQVKLTDSVSDGSDASSSVAASAKAVKDAYNAATEIMVGASDSEAGKAGIVPAPQAGQNDFFLRGDGTWAVASGLPLGHFFTWPFSTPPDGSIVVNGSAYSRTLYADLWTYISSKSDWVKTESEWQSIASANGGYCPYYSDGDGSTTFRVPKFAPYQQLAISAADAGEYRQAGLPTLGGDIEVLTHRSSPTMTGPFTPRSLSQYSLAGNGPSPIYGVMINLAASRQSNVYGKSTTVQPESNKWIVCVVAYGKATNVGNVDVANVMSAVGTVQAEISDVLTEISDVLNKIMPVGSVYVQFSGQSAPADLFGGTWSNVSSTYAGLFFRAEGGLAAAFGSSQGGGLPNISGAFDRSDRNGFAGVEGAFYNPGRHIGGYARDDARDSAMVGFSASRSSSIYGSAAEVRPVNSTIRIWKRTA